jgi:putative endopeptidase
VKLNLKKLKTLLLVFVLVTLTLTGYAREKIPPLERAYMDVSVRPGDDFFRYTNGTWIDALKIPDDKTSYNMMDIVRENTDQMVRQLLEATAKITSAEKGSAVQKISDFYATGMDVEKIEADGLAPLKDELARIDKIANLADVQEAIIHFHTRGLTILFNEAVFQDLQDSKIFKFYLMQSGLGMPDRDYYVTENQRSQEIRAQYVKHVAKMFELLGDAPDTAAANAKTVMMMETRLAKNSKTRLEWRDWAAFYNKMTPRQLRELTPAFDWDRYFKTISDIDFGDVVVGMPKFFQEIDALMKEVPVKDWKTYLRWHLLNKTAPYLSSAFVLEDYRFNEEFMSGGKKIKERWQRVVQTTNDLMGELVGQLYVEKYFPPEYKKRMVELVDNLKKAMAIRIRKLQWMSETTKAHALDKLEKMRVKIGYPDQWEDHAPLEIKRDSYIANVLRAKRFEFTKNLALFGKPVDPGKWPMPPQTVNAGYHPLKNDITFPAGILQPPFFNPEADDAVNYGSIGMVIGHEMTHGFDDKGRKFDKEGNMKDWWTKEDAEEFNRQAQLLVDQYDNFVAIDELHVNGKLTLGENIADFAGLTIAFTAYQLSRQGKSKPQPIDGFTDEQRFFLAYAQLWRGKIRDKALRRLTQEDVHPWGKFRVNGTLFNVPEFYKAFAIKPGDKLYRSEAQRPVLW